MRRVKRKKKRKEAADLLQGLARIIDARLNGDSKVENREWGFALLVFPFGDAAEPRVMDYVSNADRLNMRVLFKEQLARLEARIQDNEPSDIM
ncbi:MAG: hypothetical protein OXI69_15395 [Acidobacteriota bacterium]|nr:hypothetical protein [Acidobacteriota bacterium]